MCTYIIALSKSQRHCAIKKHLRYDTRIYVRMYVCCMFVHDTSSLETELNVYMC